MDFNCVLISHLQLLNGVGGENFEGDEDSDDFEKEMDAEIQQTMQHKLPPKVGKHF